MIKKFDEFVNEAFNTYEWGGAKFAPIDTKILNDLNKDLNAEFHGAKTGEPRTMWEDALKGKGPLDKILKKYKAEIGDPTSANTGSDFRFLLWKGEPVAFVSFEDDGEMSNGYISITNKYKQQ